MDALDKSPDRRLGPSPRLSLRVDAETYERLQRVAQQRDETISDFVREALDDRLAQLTTT